MKQTTSLQLRLQQQKTCLSFLEATTTVYTTLYRDVTNSSHGERENDNCLAITQLLTLRMSYRTITKSQVLPHLHRFSSSVIFLCVLFHPDKALPPKISFSF